MISKITIDAMAAWCRTAKEALRSAGFQQQTIDSASEAIESNSKIKSIYAVAKELADIINDLDTEDRTSAQALLVSENGFGINLFINRQERKAISIIKRNKICKAAEYELIHNLASSPDSSHNILQTYETLMVEYEETRRSPK